MDVNTVTDALGTTASSAPAPSEPLQAPVSPSPAPPPEAPLREYEGTQVDTSA